MLATFIIEILLALYTALTQRGIIARISILLLLCLAAFQISEYTVCGGPESIKLAWTKFGLVCISFLPALGVHLASKLTRQTLFVHIGYAAAFISSVAFITIPHAAAPGYCLGNYVLIALPNARLTELYSYYYFGFILIGMSQLIWGMFYEDKKTLSPILYWARLWFLLGYLSFTVPMGIWAFIEPAARPGTPSIMCGFALSLAVIVALRVVPLGIQSEIEKRTTR